MKEVKRAAEKVKKYSRTKGKANGRMQSISPTFSALHLSAQRLMTCSLRIIILLKVEISRWYG